MQHGSSKTSFVELKPFLAGVVVGLLVSWFTSCAHGPTVDTCLSDPASQGMQCVDKQGQGYFKAYGETENFVCLPPDDFKILLQYYHNRCVK
jgi:hypothetical protein